MLTLLAFLVLMMALNTERLYEGSVSYLEFELMYGENYSGDYDAGRRTPQYNELGFVKTNASCAFRTHSNFEKSVLVRVHEKAPQIDESADTVSDCGIIEVSKPVFVLFPNADGPPEKLQLPHGKYELRYSQFKIDTADPQTEEGKDHYTIDLWPAN